MNDRLPSDLAAAADRLAVPSGDLDAVLGRAGRRSSRRRRVVTTITTLAVVATTAGGINLAGRGRRATPLAAGSAAVRGDAGIAWQRVQPGSALGFASSISTGDAGPIYALSTAAGQVDFSRPNTRVVWRSEDGIDWTAAATLGTDFYLSDLSVQGQRVYAIGTGPASVALPGPGAGDLFVGWSDDGGRSFQRQKLPVDMAAIGMGASRVWVGDTEVVAGPNGVVAVAQVGALLNVRALLPAGVTAPNGWVTTATGVDLLGAGAPAACPTPQPRGDVSERIAPDAKGPSESGPGEVQPTWCAGPDGEPTSLIAPQEGRGVLTSYTWADLGVAGELLGAVRGQPIGFFAPPGSTRFERVDLPPTGRPGGPVLLEAGDQGFEMVLTEMVADRVVPGRVNITVLRSDDGRSWSALGTNQADAQWITAAGRLDGRLTLVGSSDSGAKVSSRSDTGAWTTTDLSGVVGAGVPGRTHVVSAGIGPLGIAAVVVTVEEGGPDAGPGRRQPVMSLLTSRDGRTWSNEPLADLVGQPVGSVSRVVVDDRRIVVAAHPARPDRRQDEPPTPSTQVLLVGTPE